jgi:hypothetical protein
VLIYGLLMTAEDVSDSTHLFDDCLRSRVKIGGHVAVALDGVCV